jgi:hypothetical protein
MKGSMKKLLLLLALAGLLTGCEALRKASATGRKVANIGCQVKDTAFDAVDGAIDIGENVKTNITSVFKKK